MICTCGHPAHSHTDTEGSWCYACGCGEFTLLPSDAEPAPIRRKSEGIQLRMERDFTIRASVVTIVLVLVYYFTR